MDSQLPAIAAPARRSARARTFVPPVDHALQALTLHGDRAVRLSHAAGATAQMMARGLDEQDWDELWRMHGAIQHRLADLRRHWALGWFDWLAYTGQIEGANTLSKLAERENNIMGQAVDLAGEQVQDLFGLMESIEVGYLFWVTQKTGPAPAA